MQIRADPPVLIVRSLVVNPSAPWCLEKWVNQQQQELPSRGNDSGDFANRRLEWIYVLKGETQDHRIKCGAPEWNLLCKCLHESRWTAANIRLSDLRGCGVKAHDIGSATGNMASDLSLAASHIEHTPCPS